jgi:hypothetical protein
LLLEAKAMAVSEKLMCDIVCISKITVQNYLPHIINTEGQKCSV